MLRRIKLALLGAQTNSFFGRDDLLDGWGSRANVNATTGWRQEDLRSNDPPTTVATSLQAT